MYTFLQAAHVVYPDPRFLTMVMVFCLDAISQEPEQRSNYHEGRMVMLKKRYIADNTICKVTFILPATIEARTATVVGDFNNWDKDATPMEQLKDGTWKAEIKLEAGREYQYRYFVNGSEWHNDWNADKYIAHPYGGENSVVAT
jgi:1,4-alpha-glucan branching enzyme